MKILKGTKLQVRHRRKGAYKAYAEKDFDTDDEWYPMILAENEYVEGLNIHNDWEEGESIPGRKGLCTVEVIK